MGHVRDLPKGAAEIPAAVKKEKWSRIGVNTTEDFEPLYIVPKDKKKVVKELKDALKGATTQIKTEWLAWKLCIRSILYSFTLVGRTSLIWKINYRDGDINTCL